MVQIIDRHQPCGLWLPIGILVKKDPFWHQHIAGAGGGGDVQCAERAIRERQPRVAAALAQPVAPGRDSSVHGESLHWLRVISCCLQTQMPFQTQQSDLCAKDRLQRLEWSIGVHLMRFCCCLQVLHVMILYVPWAAALFSVTALSWADWAAVLWLSAPVVLLDECLKVRGPPLPPNLKLPGQAPVTMNTCAGGGRYSVLQIAWFPRHMPS
jgi:Cation transporting ATPase, C-terminus